MNTIKRFAAPLGTLALLLSGTCVAHAGTVLTVDNTDANSLAAAITAGGAGGITITNATLSTNTNSGGSSSGIFTTSGSNNFGLGGSGIVISSGEAGQDGTSGPVINFVSTQYGTDATAAQTTLLSQVSPLASSFHDVTELTVTFNASAATNQVFFNTVFTSAEYPVYVGQFIDGFGLFLNGTNIAFAGGNPVNIDSPLMVNTDFPSNGGIDGTAYQTTPEAGVLVQNGSAVITYGGSVVAGSIGNTLTFIVADANDSALDTTAFIQGLGNAAPPPTGGVPEPTTWAMMILGLGGVGATLRSARKKQALGAVAV